MANIAQTRRTRRKAGIRSKVRGSQERPRLTVYRSLKHVYAQVIDDDASRTLLQVSTCEKQRAGSFAGMPKRVQAKKVGELVGALCIENGIQQVVFDRNGYKYHGRVQAVAAGAREVGLRF